MQVLLSCSNKLCSFQIWENASNSKRDKRPSHWHPSLSTLHPPAVTDGQNVTVQLQVVASLSSVSWLCLIYLQPCVDLWMCLAIYSGIISNAFACNYSHIMLSIIDTSLKAHAHTVPRWLCHPGYTTATALNVFTPNNSVRMCTCTYIFLYSFAGMHGPVNLKEMCHVTQWKSQLVTFYTAVCC